MFFIVLVLTHIHAAILPLVLSLAMHLVIQPLSLVLPTITPNIHTKTVDFVVLPVPYEITAVFPRILTLTIFLPLGIVTLISTAIDPCLGPFAMLIIFEPLSFIFGPVVMLVCSISARLIVLPLSVVEIPVHMRKLASVKI